MNKGRQSHTHPNIIAKPQNITPSAPTPNARMTFLRLSTLPNPAAAALLVVEGLALAAVIGLVGVPLSLSVVDDVISVIVVERIGPPGFVMEPILVKSVEVLATLPVKERVSFAEESLEDTEASLVADAREVLGNGLLVKVVITLLVVRVVMKGREGGIMMARVER